MVHARRSLISRLVLGFRCATASRLAAGITILFCQQILQPVRHCRSDQWRDTTWLLVDAYGRAQSNTTRGQAAPHRADNSESRLSTRPHFTQRVATDHRP